MQRFLLSTVSGVLILSLSGCVSHPVDRQHRHNYDRSYAGQDYQYRERSAHKRDGQHWRERNKERGKKYKRDKRYDPKPYHKR
ncbi:hypothetical protein ACF3NA_05510 [Alkanindiges sp. WGS2144]|uniref:hypothetical protein n=1 Tax=Alkanindiges sp. WGS2144 TaxID=3366808 RepID=UPI003752CB1E